MTRKLDAALRYADQLGPILPLHTAHDGVCDCAKRGDCPKPGKHPRTEHGLDDASDDGRQIRRWWSMWPDANIGLALKPAGLIDVAPDSEHWLEVFKRRGLPRTLTYQSGSGAGHQHHLYQQPPDWPTTRVCRTGEFDILSDGYAVLPPSTNGAGPYVWLDQVDHLPVAPLWVKEHLPNRSAPPGSNLPLGAEDEPPVRLTGRALDRWHGATDAFRVADRSGKLFAIANDLARANASMHAIAMALADRDQVLGLDKFSDRDDADSRYVDIALRALANLDDADTTRGQVAPWSDEDEPPKMCGNHCQAQELVDTIRGVLANKHHSRASAKVSIIGLLLRHGWAFSRAPGVERPVNLTVLSDDVGLSNSTISSGLRLYDGKPGSPLQWRQGPAVDGNFAKPTFVTLRAKSLSDFGTKAREFDPDIRKWGGDRSSEPPPPCEHGHPAVMQVTQRQVRQFLVATDGDEYADTGWQDGRMTVQWFESNETLESPDGADNQLAPQDGTTITEQLAPQSPRLIEDCCSRCSRPGARPIPSRALGRPIPLCERCWPAAPEPSAAVAS